MSRVHTFIHEHPGVGMSPSPVSIGSDMSRDSSNEVPREYTMGPSPEPVVEDLSSFAWRQQQPSVGTSSAGPYGHAHRRQQKGKQPQQQQQYSDHYMFDDEEPAFTPSRLAHERRLAICLDTLRQIHLALRAQHHEAEQHLDHVSRLISQTSWDLFFQSPQAFIDQKMAAAAAAAATVPAAAIPEPQYVWGETGAWTRSLSGLNEMCKDEAVMKQAVERLEKQIEYVVALMEVGAREQAVILLGGDPLVDHYRRAYDRSSRYYGQTTKQGGGSKTAAAAAAAAAAGMSVNTAASSSAFTNWPLPAQPLADMDANCHCEDHRAPTAGQEFGHGSSTGPAGVSPNVQAVAAALRALNPQELLMVLQAVDYPGSGSEV